MVAADDDRRLELAGRDESIELETGACALAVAEPADPGRQTLERDSLAGHLEPAVEPVLVREQLDQGAIGPIDVVRVAR